MSLKILHKPITVAQLKNFKHIDIYRRISYEGDRYDWDYGDNLDTIIEESVVNKDGKLYFSGRSSSYIHGNKGAHDHFIADLNEPSKYKKELTELVDLINEVIVNEGHYYSNNVVSVETFNKMKAYKTVAPKRSMPKLNVRRMF